MNTTKIYPIPLGIVQVFLLQTEQGSVLIDAGNPGHDQKILQACTAHGVDPQEISLIVITHCHSDHFGSLAILKERCGAKVAIHALEAEALSHGKDVEICPVTTMGHIFKRIIPKNVSIPGVDAEILIENELDLKEYGVNAQVISTPGHTPGSVSVVLEDEAAIIGDLIMGGLIRQRVPNYPWFATDMSNVKKSITRILNFHPETVYASHGGPFAPETVARRLL